MRLKFLFILLLIAIAAMEAAFIVGSTLSIVYMNERSQAREIEKDLNRIFESKRTELIGNVMLNHNQLLWEQLHQIGIKEGIELRLKSGSSVLEINTLPGMDKVTQPFSLEYGGQKYGTLTLLKPRQNLLEGYAGAVVLFVVVQILLFGLLLFGAYYWFIHFALQPLERVLETAKTGVPVHKNSRWVPRELSDLAEGLSQLWLNYRIQSQQAAIGKLSLQVAHDIRSPLFALSVAIGGLEEIPEERRLLIRRAVERIEDIANNLRLRNEPRKESSIKEISFGRETTINMLSSSIEAILSEKRESLRDFSIHFKWDSTCAYGIFVQTDVSLLRRVLSNLIENAIEALEPQNGGQIEISVRQFTKGIELSISDNGVGIPPEILPRLMEWGQTFGKTQGSGLGLFQAKQALEQWGGKLSLQSKQGQGTQVLLLFPKVMAPDWFVSEIQIADEMDIVVLDDDHTIHETWKQRMAHFLKSHTGIQMHSAHSPESFRKTVAELRTNARPKLYLCDYELIGSPTTGLQLIEELNLQAQSILVTSYGEDSAVYTECTKLGLRLLPKSVAKEIPIISRRRE